MHRIHWQVLLRLNMKNKHIDTFETIYGVDVVVANKEVTVEDLRELYTYSDGVEIEDTSYEAVTCTCKNKETGRFVILVWYRDMRILKGESPKLRYINAASHEAFHVVNDLMDFSNQEVDPRKSNEFMAYMVGYFTERIYNTWTKK